jgi:iron(III) transport system permease protein
VLGAGRIRLVSQYPPRIPLAAAMGVSLSVVMFLMVYVYRRIVGRGCYVTITGKAFRPRVMTVGRLRWLLLGVCATYLFISVALPIVTLAYASVQKLATAFPAPSNWTLGNFATALSLDAVRSALWNSLFLGFVTATWPSIRAAASCWKPNRMPEEPAFAQAAQQGPLPRGTAVPRKPSDACPARVTPPSIPIQ